MWKLSPKKTAMVLPPDYEKGSMEAIEEQLKNIDHHLESISGSLKKLSRCVTEAPERDVFTICGAVSTSEY